MTSAGEIGTGVRRIIPIVGGEVKGEGINGKVCAFGADFQIIRPNELIELEAKYAFETDDGAVVYVENKGLRFGPVELLQKLKRGEPVDPKLIYFRTVPRFETGAAKYRWLMENLFIGSAARHADRVVIDVHQVLVRHQRQLETLAPRMQCSALAVRCWSGVHPHRSRLCGAALSRCAASGTSSGHEPVVLTPRQNRYKT